MEGQLQVSTPDLHLKTTFILNGEGRIVSTREPGANRGPRFSIVRSATCCAWAARADLPKELAGELDRLAREEPPTIDLHDAPVHADRYLSLVGGQVGSGHEAVVKTRQSDGPAFTFLKYWCGRPMSSSLRMSGCLSTTFEGGYQGRLLRAGRRCFRSSRMGIRSVFASALGVLMARRRQVLRPRRRFVAVGLVRA